MRRRGVLALGYFTTTEGERILGVVYGAEGQVGGPGLWKTYDLVFTNVRLVGVVVAHSGANQLALGMASRGLDVGIAGSVSKGAADRQRSALEGEPLDAILGLDKASFSAPYGRIENPRIKGLIDKTLHMKVRGKRAVFKLPKATVEQVQRIMNQTFPGTMI